MKINEISTSKYIQSNNQQRQQQKEENMVGIAEDVTPDKELLMKEELFAGVA